jgi:hypothetical protein
VVVVHGVRLLASFEIVGARNLASGAVFARRGARFVSVLIGRTGGARGLASTGIRRRLAVHTRVGVGVRVFSWNAVSARGQA